MNLSKQTINKKLLLTVLLLGSFLSVLNQTLLNVALPDLMKLFDVSPSTIQWLSTGFMLVNGILVPATAYLMKRFTTRQLFLSSMVLLLIGTLLNAVAPTFTVLLIGRMIQAAGAGIIMPLLMTVVLVIFPEEGRGTAMGTIGLVMIFAPAIGPTLAGFVIESLSWRWLFIGMSPLIFIVILLSLKFLVNVSETSKAKLDITSIILSTIGFGGILYGFSSAGSKGWGSTVVLSYLIGGAIFLVLFCWRQLTSTDPLLDIRVFKNKVFTITTIVSTFVMMVMYGDMILLPIYLQTARGYSVLETGLLLLPGALINALMSPLSGRLFDKVGAKPLALIGLILIIPSMWGVTHLTETTSFTYLMVRTIILRIGLSCMTMPLSAAGLNALPKQMNAHGSAVNNTVRQLAGAIGTALVITIFTNSSTEHATTLMHEGAISSKAQLLLDASILGMNDAFFFSTIMAILALVVTFFMAGKKADSKQRQAPAERGNLNHAEEQ
ncbi:DHA2 family efflux MFS transporter permease subunit [Bacillus sp. DNRA2]|uniref:DHA2 family efflux MFS transporter permease subunit n=1 Tax=Bacillus sp. DNRA2 TaxID=2723053 RepID=UPI00145F55D7|nr:DHA2 family efflux MFS transporter permease subunit [Bacillus sp. DNRA2]NMD69821.1 DHA2 family efflux MFS transporter permease subunit [Bacillus sp. DNRA2]